MATFKEQLDADLSDVFFQTGVDSESNDASEFAEEATYEPKADDQDDYPIDIIYDETYNEVDPQGDGLARVQSKYIRVMVKEADVRNGGAKKGDEMLVRGQRFYVVTAETNGVGVLLITLHKKPA